MWPSDDLLRHDRAVREAPTGFSRRWAWVYLSVVVFFSFYFVGSLRDGHVWGVWKYGLFILVGISGLVRSLTPGQHPLAGVARVVGGVAFGALCTGGAVRFTIDAVQASGGERIFLAVVAVFFYLFAAMLIVGTILRPELLPGDAATTETSGDRGAKPHGGDAPPDRG